MLGNDSAVYYMSPFCNNTVHRDQGFDFVDIGHWTNHANANGAQNHLQPELAETTFYLRRATGDRVYFDAARTHRPRRDGRAGSEGRSSRAASASV